MPHGHLLELRCRRLFKTIPRELVDAALERCPSIRSQGLARLSTAPASPSGSRLADDPTGCAGSQRPAEQVLVCSGFTQGLTLVCRALRRRGVRRVAVEDPCFAHHRQAIAMTGLEPVPVPVDRLGLDPGQLPSNVGAILIAPAHSYPRGVTLSASRRHELIDWARRVDAIVIEDDYDAEFR